MSRWNLFKKTPRPQISEPLEAILNSLKAENLGVEVAPRRCNHQWIEVYHTDRNVGVWCPSCDASRDFEIARLGRDRPPLGEFAGQLSEEQIKKTFPEDR